MGQIYDASIQSTTKEQQTELQRIFTRIWILHRLARLTLPTAKDDVRDIMAIETFFDGVLDPEMWLLIKMVYWKIE